ncbi:hypothetical protein HY838_00295 [Candidatus Azambacteria bacterium]|nr:hypothetical protein [Candidatus Azambacteria bacterium]
MKIDSKYISLKSAAGLYGYTRDHLGLMIRRGKLQGVKLGSYYVTTNEWMADYIKNFADPNHPTAKGKLSNRFLSKILSAPVNAAPSVRKKGAVAAAIDDKQTKSGARSKNDFNNDLGKKILDELTRYGSFPGDYNDNVGGDSGIGGDLGCRGNNGGPAKDNAGQLGPFFANFSNAPYVILPIRKMEDGEREKILRKLP